MTTEDTGRAGEIEGRVVEWVNAALTTTDTADAVGVAASATRVASLPDDGLEVRPEDWTVEVVLRFSEADGAKSAEVLGRIAESTGTVTLGSGEAAEISWPADGPSAERVDDGPADTPFRSAVPVAVTIPWPSHNDEGAGAA